MSRDDGVIRITEHRVLVDAMGLGAREVVVFTGAGAIAEVMDDLSSELSMEGRVVVTATTQLAAPPGQAGAPLILAERCEDVEAGVRDGFVSNRCVVVTRSPLADGRLRGLPRKWIDQLVGACIAEYVIVAADTSRGELLKMPGMDEPIIPSCATLVVPVAGADALDKPVSDGIVHRPEVLAAKLGLQFRQRIEAKHIAAALVGPGGCASDAPEGVRVLPLLTNAGGVADVKLRTIVYALRKVGSRVVIAHGGMGVARVLRFE